MIKICINQLKKKGNTKRVFFYARPVTPRRVLMIGLFALNLLCQKMPEVEVVFAGWDVSTFEIPFKHRNMGIMSVDRLPNVIHSVIFVLLFLILIYHYFHWRLWHRILWQYVQKEQTVRGL